MPVRRRSSKPQGNARRGPGEPDEPSPGSKRRTTRLTPPAVKIGEGATNLRDRADAFKRRRRTTG